MVSLNCGFDSILLSFTLHVLAIIRHQEEILVNRRFLIKIFLFSFFRAKVYVYKEIQLLALLLCLF